MITDIKKITKKKLLLVEGFTDARFCELLLDKYLGLKDVVQVSNNIDDLITINYVRGISNFKNKLENLKVLPGFRDVEKIGIIADSDNRPIDKVFNEIKIDVIEACGFTPPVKINEFSKGDVKTIVHIIDCKDEKGCLESLCLQAIKHTYAKPVIEKFEKEVVKFSDDKKPKCMYKAKLQVYMAAMKEIAHYPARGAGKGYFDLENPVFADLKNFLGNFAE